MRSIKCPQCQTIVQWEPGTTPRCPTCGFSSPPASQAPVAAPTVAQPQGHPQSPQGYGQPHGAPKPAPSEGVAIAALLVNLLVIPGVGTIIGGRTGEGVAQLLLMVFGFVLLIVLIGFFMMAAAWIWALVSGIQILQEAQRARPQPQG